MNEYEELIRHIREWKIKETINEEKAYLDELAIEYKQEQNRLALALVSILATAEKKGIVRSEDLFKFGRIEKIEQEIGKSLSTLNVIEKKRITEQMKKQLERTIVETAFLHSQFGNNKKITVTPKDIDNILITPWAGEVFSETLKRKKLETVGQVKRELIIASSGAGATMNEVQGVVKKRMEGSLKHSLLVLQNELNHLDFEGEQIVSNKLNVKTKVKWLAAFDDRTCYLCSPLDGKEFERENLPLIPVHPRCRCTTVTLIDNWEQTLRSGRDLKTMKTYLTDAKNIEAYKKEQGIFQK